MPIPIYTIGHGSRTIEEFFLLLHQYQIAYVIDVRSLPYSKFNPDFSKVKLERLLKGMNFQYIFMGDLLGGRPNLPSCYTDGKVDYEKLRKKDFYLQGIARLRKAWEQQLAVVVMCSEGKPEECHRSKLIGETLVRENIEVGHIDENGNLLSHEEVIARLHRGQFTLFGPADRAFRSRKKYLNEGDDRQSGEDEDD